MPNFFYKAKKDSIHTVTGQVQAAHMDEAVEMIHQLGLVPVQVSETNDHMTALPAVGVAKVKGKDIGVFSRQLAGLLKSGLPILKALEMLSTQQRNVYFSHVIAEISVGVKSGRMLSACLADYESIFSPLYVAMIKAGEEMGQLKLMLISMSDFLQAQEQFASKVRHALVYPMVMLVVAIATIAFILTFVMPKVTVIFVQSHQVLPWPTRIVMGFSQFLRIAGLPMLLVAVIGLVSFNRWRLTPNGQIIFYQLLMQVPGLNTFLLKVDLARFTRTLQLLLESKLPIVKAIETAVGTIRYPLLRAQLLWCAQQVAGGESLASSMDQISLLEPMMVQQIAVAQEAGNVAEALADIANIYEADVDATTRAVTVLIEPMMIVGVGTIVGFIVFAMLMPIFSMDILAR